MSHSAPHRSKRPAWSPNGLRRQMVGYSWTGDWTKSGWSEHAVTASHYRRRQLAETLQLFDRMLNQPALMPAEWHR